MHIVVVGAGIMGLSTAWAALKAGHEVTVVEQSSIPNEAGSSVDESRLIRHPYGPMTGYARLMDEGFAAWDRLWEDLGETHYRETGTLVMGEPGETWVAASAEHLSQGGKSFDWLGSGDIERRFPALSVPDGCRAIYMATGGVLLARPIVRDLARWLAAHGAVLRTDTKVARIDPETATCHVTGGGTIKGDRLCVAAGPWTNDLFNAPVTLKPSRQVVTFLEPPAPFAAAWSDMPMILDFHPHARAYWVPPVGGAELKVGTHKFAFGAHPDDDRLVGRQEAMSAFANTNHILRSSDLYDLKGGRSCFYTVSDDENFVVRPISENAWFLAGFSGHGFKFGALMGEIVVRAIDGKMPTETAVALAAGDIVEA
ncbi:MAG: FAD-dependent oxidoreductase [Pseudomonadota bacterium]